MTKNKIRSKQPVYGTWCEIYSPYASDIISHAGLDFVVLDLEHGPLNMETVQNMTFASQRNGCDVFVRVSEYEKAAILNVLDMGINGIIYPHVQTIEQINEIVKKTMFNPAGNRGYNPFVCSCGYKSVSKDELKKKNENLMVGVIIEDMEGIQNLSELVKSPVIDVFYIGQYDLSISLGMPGDIYDETIISIITDAVKTINAAGKTAGCMVHDSKGAVEATKDGFGMILYGVDTNVLYRGYNTFVQEVKMNETI